MEEVEKIYMSIEEATKRYGIGKSSIYELFGKDGCPPIRKFKHKTLIPVKEFDEFMDLYLGYYSSSSDE